MSIYNSLNRRTIDAYLAGDRTMKRKRPEVFDELLAVCFWARNLREAIYYYRNDLSSPLLCKICNEMRKPKHLYCGKKCQGLDKELYKRIHTPESRVKYKETMVVKYGVENSFMLDSAKESRARVQNERREEILEKRERTNLERFGCVNYATTLECRQKIEVTCLEKFGTSTFFGSDEGEQARNKGLEKFNDPVIRQEILDKRASANLRKYGVKHPAQNKDIFERACATSVRQRLYLASNNLEYSVMGYEDMAIEFLLDLGYTDFVTSRKDIPSFKYLASNDKRRYYHPDIILDNTVIEVKSTYTLAKDIDKVRALFKAVTGTGFQFRVFVFDRRRVGSTPQVIHDLCELDGFISRGNS